MIIYVLGHKYSNEVMVFYVGIFFRLNDSRLRF